MCKFNFFQNSYEIDIIKIKNDKKTNYIEPCLACPKGLVQDAILALKQNSIDTETYIIIKVI